MPTTEETRSGLVLPEFGPTGPELVRERLSRRGRITLAVVAAAVVALVALLIVTGGDDLSELAHESSPQFTMLHPDAVRPSAPGPGEIVRFRAQRRGLRLLVAVRRLDLPAYEGSVAGLLPILADRQEKALAQELPGFRLRAEGKARVNDAPGYQLRYRSRDVTNGIDILVVPEDGDREGVLLRFRQSNPPRALGAAQKELVKATRKVFRSFRFGLDRP
jgi:hypothetical protein